MSLFKYFNSLRFKHKVDAKVHWQARMCVYGLYIFHQVKPTRAVPSSKQIWIWLKQSKCYTTDWHTERHTRKISIMICTTKRKSYPINVECCKGFKMENVSWIWTALRWQQDLYTKEGSRYTTDDRLLIPTQQQLSVAEALRVLTLLVQTTQRENDEWSLQPLNTEFLPQHGWAAEKLLSHR